MLRSDALTLLCVTDTQCMSKVIVEGDMRGILVLEALESVSVSRLSLFHGVI